MARMLLQLVIFLASLLVLVDGKPQSFSPINTDKYPSVVFYSKGTGYFSLQAGVNGNITFETAPNDTIYYKNIDLLHIIQLVNATPPVWEDYGTYGYLGVFRGLRKVSVFVRATDAAGLDMNYTAVAGDLPVGISIHPDTGELRGVAPDVDATYVFTLRATNQYGKFADAIFKMVIKDSHVCKETPCKNEGTCVEANGNYVCHCLNPYGGSHCELKCSEQPLGISTAHKIVHNAQMSAYKTSGAYFAYNGRVGGSGWMGTGTDSWLQVDLGNQTIVHGVEMAGLDTSHYTTTYNLQYSSNGQDFESYVSQLTGKIQVMRGSSTASPTKTMLDGPIRTRFVRFIPITFGRTGPYMRVELLGCHSY